MSFFPRVCTLFRPNRGSDSQEACPGCTAQLVREMGEGGSSWAVTRLPNAAARVKTYHNLLLLTNIIGRFHAGLTRWGGHTCLFSPISGKIWAVECGFNLVLKRLPGKQGSAVCDRGEGEHWGKGGPPGPAGAGSPQGSARMVGAGVGRGMGRGVRGGGGRRVTIGD